MDGHRNLITTMQNIYIIQCTGIPWIGYYKWAVLSFSLSLYLHQSFSLPIFSLFLVLSFTVSLISLTVGTKEKKQYIYLLNTVGVVV